ncbi:MAG: hypothetical protein JNL08_20850 [Planctomycetes bacterium]|nr:hypothetical protein [Planctomycetota bacterium]
MNRLQPTSTFLTCALALAGHATAQQMLITTDTGTDSIVAFSPVDGSLIGANQFAIDTLIQVSAIEVGSEIWVSQQIGDRIKRYDHCGNWLGDIGPTFPGGGLDNVRGMVFHNGVVYACNDGGGNGATPNSLTTFDAAGNWLATYALAGINSPFGVVPFQGDLLVTGSSGLDDVHRYTTAGVSLGTFHNSTSVNFAHQVGVASDGNVWVASSSTPSGVTKLDAANGNVLLQFAGTSARGVYELANGNVLWTGSAGAFVYDPSTSTSTQVYAGSCYQLNPVATDWACHKPYGVGCHDWGIDSSNLLQLFGDVPGAKAALDGNALQFALTGTGYTATWLPGVAAGLWVAPTAGATVVADGTATTGTFTPSAPIPVPGGVATAWTVSSEGVLTAGAEGNQGTSSTATLASTATQPGLAWYTWFNQNPVESGSGKIQWEELGGVLYVTFDGVECGVGSPTIAPSTYQWQIDMASGTVTMLWTSLSGSNSTSDVLVGCTLAGAGLTPVSTPLASALPLVLAPDPAPMALTAAPRPVINPSTLVSYTATSVPEFAPGAGIYVGTMFLSVNPLPGGFDLAGILTTVPGCSTWIATLDLDLGGTLNVAPTLTWTFAFDSAFFAPGNVIAAQAVALFDPAFPQVNGEAGGFLFSNGVRSTTWPQ